MARNHMYTSAEWTVLELPPSIHNEIRIFETGQLSSLSSLQNPTASFATSLHRKQHARKEGSKLVYVFCKGSHSTLNCEVHKDVASHVDIIKQQRLCFNCLAHHRASQCNSKNQCRKCGSKHHTSICNEPPKQTTADNNTATPSNVAKPLQLVLLIPHLLLH